MLAARLALGVLLGVIGSRITSSCSGRSNPKRGAPQARHFIMRSRRAGQGSAPPLNCGVSRHV